MSGSTDTGGWRLIVERLVAAGRWISQPDELPEPKVYRGSVRSFRDLLTWLIAPDQLPLETQPVRNSRRVWSTLVSFEPIPNARPESGQGTHSFFHWLLLTEKLPSPAAESATKEASFDEP